MALVSRGMNLTTYQELSEYRNVFSCLLCLEFFSNPRVLDCHHIFCEQCLESYYNLFHGVHLQQERFLAMPCPTCRRLTTTLAGGPLPLDMTNDRVLLTRRKLSRQADVSPKCDPCALRDRTDPADFFCNKCALNMCRSCRSAHDQHHLFAGHVIIHVSNKETLDLYCDTHSKMPSIYFCLECGVAACVVCILHSHSTHRTSKLRDALSVRRDHLKTLLNEFGPRLDKIEAKIKRLTALAADDHPAPLQQQQLPYLKSAAKPGGSVQPLFYRKSPENGSRHKSSEFDRFGKGPTSIMIVGRKMVRSASSPANYATRIAFANLEGGVRGGDGGAGSGRGVQGRQSQTAVSERLRNWYIEERGLDSCSSDSSRDSLTQCSGNFKEIDVSSERSTGTSATLDRSLDVTDAITGEERLTSETQTLIPVRSIRRCGLATISQSDESNHPSDFVKAEDLVVTLADLTTQTTRHRKLYNLSTKILEMSQSKKLFAIYEDVVDRIQTVLDSEMQFIQDVLEEHISLELIRKNNSFLLEQTSRDFQSSLRGSLSSSGAQADIALLSMLIRPKLLWKVEKQRSDVTEMWNPCDVAFLPDESAIVAEYDNISDRNNKLQIFDLNGRPLEALAQGQIQPLGVAVTREGHIAVTDCKGKRIKILTTTGQSIMDIGKGQFGWPYGIAINSRGQLIVTDAFNDTVSIYQMDGKRTKIFGSTGSQNSQFRNPYHVTVDARDNIIVSDSGNSCIKVFDASGKFLFHSSEAMRKPSADVIGERTVKRRKLRGPRGVTVDLKGNILVADDCCRVCMFDSNGRYVRNLLTEEDSVKFPEAVHCSSGGLLAVTEWNPSNMFAVKMFNMYE